MNSKDSWHYASTKKRGSLWSALMRKILMQERSVKGWEQFQMGKRERERPCAEREEAHCDERLGGGMEYQGFQRWY